VENLPFPLLKRFTGAHLMTVGGLAYLAGLIMFIGFFVYGYDQSLTSAFVATSMKSGQCSYVKRAMSGYFSSSIDGFWEGEAKFQHIRSLYSEYNFNSLTATDL
jgi:hypothetical protein